MLQYILLYLHFVTFFYISKPVEYVNKKRDESATHRRYTKAPKSQTKNRGKENNYQPLVITQQTKSVTTRDYYSFLETITNSQKRSMLIYCV